MKGQTALVTGASRGLGRAIAVRLAREGAAVCVNFLTSEADADRVVDEIRRAGGRAVAVRTDVGDPAAVRRMVERVEAELSPISILVNNAGLSVRGTLETFESADLERMRRTNVDGLIHMTRAVIPGMRERRYGRIVNITSIAAHGTSLPGTTFYAATKAAVITLTRRFAMELGAHGITVNAVAPGFFPTDMSQARRNTEQLATAVKQISERTMVGRVGHPDDISHAVAFLVAPESSFVTAQVLTVDGGRMDYIGHPYSRLSLTSCGRNLHVPARRRVRGGLRGPPGHARDDGRELPGIHRLRHVHAVARRQREHPVLHASVRGQGDGRRIASALTVQRPHLLDQRVAVLARHLDVRHEDVRSPLRQHLQRLGRRATGPDAGPGALENGRRELEGVRIIVDHQHAKIIETRALW